MGFPESVVIENRIESERLIREIVLRHFKEGDEMFDDHLIHPTLHLNARDLLNLEEYKSPLPVIGTQRSKMLTCLDYFDKNIASRLWEM